MLTSEHDGTSCTHESMRWSSPSPDMWVATCHLGGDAWFLGFVELSEGEYIAVNGRGELVGRFGDLQAGQAGLGFAPAAAVDPTPV